MLLLIKMPCFILYLTSDRDIIYQYNGSKSPSWNSVFLVACKILWCHFVSSFLLGDINKILQSCHKQVIPNHPIDLNRKVHVRISWGRYGKTESIYCVQWLLSSTGSTSCFGTCSPCSSAVTAEIKILSELCS